jgi:DNA repair exonuclease SbcCD ATPase subunit
MAEAANNEERVARLKKKLEDLSDLRNKVKALEEANEGYLKRNMELEDQLAKANSFKSQIETYKQKARSLESYSHLIMSHYYHAGSRPDVAAERSARCHNEKRRRNCS